MKKKTSSRSPSDDALVILCVHGAGPSLNKNWLSAWAKALTDIFQQDYERPIRLVGSDYHKIIAADLFHDETEPLEYARALASLGWSGFQHGLPEIFRASRGIDSLSETLKWTAGMVVRWTNDASLRRRLRTHLGADIREHAPHVILGHSLGSLVAYDAFFQDPDLVRDRHFVSFGSQIGNAFVRNVYHGRLRGLPRARRWFHLYNPHDDVFTTSIRLYSGDIRRDIEPHEINYQQVATPFDNADPLDHSAVSTGPGTIGYLDHSSTRRLVWPEIAGATRRRALTRSVRRLVRTAIEENNPTPDHRALLIGVDRYAHPSINPLEGCVNDTFLVSQNLQQQGFPVGNIRLLHNERATAAAIRDRLDWLLDDLDPGEFRLLYFSGHGHQLESYGAGEVADRVDECLCPHDYDFTTGTAIIDDFIYDLYSQLPYDSQFVMVFDCCHAGGMARAGNARVRGITSPLDIAHRGLLWVWDEESQTGRWASRTPPPDPGATAGDAESAEARFLLDRRVVLPKKFLTKHGAAALIGNNRSLRRLGRALSLRTGGRDSSLETSSRADATGPYLPVILQACAEDDVALEHTDGAAAYGAFTFAFCRALRSLRALSQELRWSEVKTATLAELKNLRYPQIPQFLYAEQQGRIVFPKIAK